MILSTLILALAASAHARPNADMCVALYEQNRDSSRLDACLGLARQFSVDQQRVMDMCDMLQVESERRGFTIQSAQLTFKGKPMTCTFTPSVDK
jgi:hypothetical protein